MLLPKKFACSHSNAFQTLFNTARLQSVFYQNLDPEELLNLVGQKNAFFQFCFTYSRTLVGKKCKHVGTALPQSFNKILH